MNLTLILVIIGLVFLMIIISLCILRSKVSSFSSKNKPDSLEDYSIIPRKFNGILNSINPEIIYSASSIVQSISGNWYFSKFEILRNLKLLFEISEKLAEYINEDSSIGILGTSGLAVGVATGLFSELPIHFIRTEGFPLPGTTKPNLGKKLILPTIEPNNKITLIDSHSVTGFSSAMIYDLFVKGSKILIDKLIIPVIFDKTINPKNIRKEMEYIYLCRFSEIAEEVSSLISGINLENLNNLVNNSESDFWSYPPLEVRDGNSYSIFDAPGLLDRPAWFIGGGVDLSIVNRINPDIQKMTRWIDPTDEGIWQFFQNPGFVKEFSLTAGKSINLENYDYLVGIGHLGTAVAISLAYYNQDQFNGSIIASLGLEGLNPKPIILRGKRVLPIHMRMQTGIYAVDTYYQIKNLDGKIEEIITVFPPKKSKGLKDILYQTSLSHFNQLGIKLTSLS